MKLIKHTEERDWFLVKEWTTAEGLKARVQKCVWDDKVKEITSALHDFCTGYVLVPKGVRISKKLEHTFNVHGGITFNSTTLIGAEKGRWLGFDLAHYMDEDIKNHEEYASLECEVLAEQIVRLTKKKV